MSSGEKNQPNQQSEYYDKKMNIPEPQPDNTATKPESSTNLITVSNLGDDYPKMLPDNIPDFGAWFIQLKEQAYCTEDVKLEPGIFAT